MRDELQAAIERAFIDLHYAEAELKTAPSAAQGAAAAIAHIRMALRELQAAVNRSEIKEAPQPQDDETV